MDSNKKKILIALLLFIFIGLTIFVFANGGEDTDNESKEPNSNRDSISSSDNSSRDDKTSSKSSGSKTLDKDSTSSSDNTSNDDNISSSENNEGKDDTSSEKPVVIDNTYELALMAVISAEKEMTINTYKDAIALIDALNASSKKTDLIDRLAVVKDIIETESLLSVLEDLVNNAASLADMNDARTFKLENEIAIKIAMLTNSEVQNALNIRLNSLLGLLNDVVAPAVATLVDGSENLPGVILNVIDNNQVTISYLKDNSDIVTVSNGFIFTEEGKYTLTAVDAAFNETVITFIIDATIPTGTFAYSNDNGNAVTKEDVIVTLTTNEAIKIPSEWTKVSDTEFTKVHNINGKFNVTIEDLAGNTAILNYEVKRIDNTLPAFLDIINGDSFNHDVIYGISKEASVIGSDFTIIEESISSIIIDGVSYSEETAPRIITGEGAHSVKVIDKASNEAEIIFTIDLASPTGTITYSNNNGNSVTKEDVIATLMVNETIKTPSGWEKINDTEFTKIYSVNGNFTVTIEDLAGNTTPITGEVKRIDKIAPAFLNITTGDLIYGDVTFEISKTGAVAGKTFTIVEENISSIIIDDISYSEKDAPRIITGEGIHIIKVIDKVGHETEISFIIE